MYSTTCSCALASKIKRGSQSAATGRFCRFVSSIASQLTSSVLYKVPELLRVSCHSVLRVSARAHIHRRDALVRLSVSLTFAFD